MKKYFKHVPNILTVFRFVLIPLIIYYLLEEKYVLGALVIILSGITDIADGYIARKYNFITDFGKLIDPVADKCILLSILYVFTAQNIIPNWIFGILIVKEILLIVGSLFLYNKKFVVSSKWYGKLGTVLFYVAIVSSIIIKLFNLPLDFDKYIYYLAMAITLFALFMYVKINLHVVTKSKEKE